MSSTTPPSSPAGTPPRRLGKFAIFCIIAVPAMLIGPGVWLLGQREYGTHLTVEVTECHSSYVGRSYAEYCTATWTRHGHLVVGDLEGSDGSHVGEKIKATVRGDTAYSQSLTLPFLLIGLGLPFVLLGVRMMIVQGRPEVISAADPHGPPAPSA